jgi:predicted RNase H-like HicB family nuclease
MQTRHTMINRGPTNYSAYSPELPGCVAVYKTLRGVKAYMKEALEIHIAGMKEDGIEIAKPTHFTFENQRAVQRKLSGFQQIKCGSLPAHPAN